MKLSSDLEKSNMTSLRDTLQGLLRYLRAPQFTDKSASNGSGNGNGPVVRTPAVLDNLLNRESVRG